MASSRKVRYGAKKGKKHERKYERLCERLCERIERKHERIHDLRNANEYTIFETRTIVRTIVRSSKHERLCERMHDLHPAALPDALSFQIKSHFAVFQVLLFQISRKSVLVRVFQRNEKVPFMGETGSCLASFRAVIILIRF